MRPQSSHETRPEPGRAAWSESGAPGIPRARRSIDDEPQPAPRPESRSTAGKAGAARAWLSVAEAAEALGLSEMTLYRAIRAGQFPAVRVRNRLIVPRRALDELTEAALTGTTPSPGAWQGEHPTGWDSPDSSGRSAGWDTPRGGRR